MRTTSAATRLSATALLLVALVSCGAETSSSSGETDGPPGISVATLTDEPFCDRVDTAMVAGVLGMSTDKVKTQVDREVGDEFEGMDEEAGPSKSVSNLCVFGSTTSQFLVSVQPEASASDVQESVDELASLAGPSSSETCESVDAASFGDPAAAFSCESGAPLERERAVVTGLVGGSKFFCSATMNQGADPDFTQATLDACRSLLEELATDA